jgi:hypothetical protein
MGNKDTNRFTATRAAVIRRTYDVHIPELRKESAQLVWNETEHAPALGLVGTLAVVPGLWGRCWGINTTMALARIAKKGGK